MELDCQLVVRGTVAAQKKSTFQEKTSHAVQLMRRNARTGGLDVLNVKLPETWDASVFAEGSKVELEVEINVFEDTVFYRAVRDLKDSRGEQRSPRPSPPAAALKA